MNKWKRSNLEAAQEGIGDQKRDCRETGVTCGHSVKVRAADRSSFGDTI